MQARNHSNLSEGSENGVAPRSGPLRVAVEGWRFYPHSYCLVNQQQCLELLNRPGVDLRFTEAPDYHQLTRRVDGTVSDAQAAMLRDIPAPDGPSDILYRISYPHNVQDGDAERTFVFATCDRVNQHGVAEKLTQTGATLVTPSNWSRDGFIRCGAAPERVVVVPHGVDTALFRPFDEDERAVIRNVEGIGDKFIFLSVSAMTGNKNTGGLLRAFAGIVRKYPHARLMLKGLNSVFASDMWLRLALDDLSDDDCKAVLPNLLFNGDSMTTANLARLYQCADAYVSPYQSEGFNIPVLEAAASGCHVIVTDGGSTDDFTTEDFAAYVPSELAVDASDGSTYLKTDPEWIAALMERAITNDSIRKQARTAGPEYVRANCTWPSVVDRLLDVLTQKGKPIPCQN